MEECDQQNWFVSEKFPEVGGRVSFKVATKDFLEVKKPKNLAFFKLSL